MRNLETKEILRHITPFHKEAKKGIIRCIKRKNARNVRNFMNEHTRVIF